MTIRKLTILLLSVIAFCVSAQVSLESDFTGRSDFKDGYGNTVGAGSMQRLKLKASIPVWYRTDTFGHQQAWIISLGATQAWLHNQGKAFDYCPSSIINANMAVSHIRSISHKWYILASLGVGLYAPNNYIRARSILGHGGVVFAYRINPDFSVGAGGGLTNSYGAPMLLPMFYLDWKRSGRIGLHVSMLNGITARVSLTPSDRVKVDITAIEFDGMSAVINLEGATKLFSSIMLRSKAEASYRIWKGLWGYAGLGVSYLRSTTIKDRKILNTFRTYKSDRFRFGAAPILTAGLRYSFTSY